MKCCTAIYNERDLSCNHAICSHCVEFTIARLGRRFGIECPKCEVPFTRTVVPKDRRNMEPDKCVRDDYDVRIEPVKGITSISLQSKIMGMTILGRNLFVVCKNSPHDIFRFSLGESDTSFEAAGKLNIPKMMWPRGLAASKKDNYLYITDWSEMFGGQLWRYRDTGGDNVHVEYPVATLDVQPFGVSVSSETDEVLVICATPVNILIKRGWIYIYKSHDEEFSRTRIVELPDLEIPRHAILTPSSLLIVCHGWTGLQSHGVTSFDDRGDETVTRKCFYGKKFGGGSGENDMNRPLSMTIDENGMILVVDYCNHRVQLLTEDFHLVRHLLTKEEHSLEYPRHVCQDPLTGRLFVAQENGKIHIFANSKKSIFSEAESMQCIYRRMI